MSAVGANKSVCYSSTLLTALSLSSERRRREQIRLFLISCLLVYSLFTNPSELQASGHVQGKAAKRPGISHVARMENERLCQEFHELLLKLPERRGPHALATLDLNRADVVLPGKIGRASCMERV